MKRFGKSMSFAAVAVVMGLVVTGCNTDSPTAPEQVLPPAQSVPSTVWNITVSADPGSFDVPEGGATFSSTVSAVVRRADNNQAPPDGATAIVSTSFGSATLVLTGGAGSVTITFTATSSGSFNVQVSFEGSTGQTTIDLAPASTDTVPPLFIEQLRPDRGSPIGGQRVRVLGTGFEEPVRVFFGASPGIVRSVTSTTIVVETPDVDLPVGQALVVSVTVEINVNEVDSASDTLAGAFTFTRGDGGDGGALVPRIISITPTSGPNEGGTEVTLRGEGFSNEVQLFFGDTTLIEAQLLNVASDQILAVTPAATGFNSPNRDSIVNVLVRNVDSGFEDTLASAFQYGSVDNPPIFISALSPTEGFYTGGDLVTIFGSGFEGPVALEMGGIGQRAISVTGTEIVLLSSAIDIDGCSEATGPVMVTNRETGSSATGPDWIYRVFLPGISGFTPSSVETDATGSPLPPGVRTTMTGSGFDPPISIVFGTLAASDVQLVDSGTVVMTIPRFPSEDFKMEDCDDNGDGTEGERLLPTSVDVEVTNVIPECVTMVVGGFTYIPPSECVGDESTAPIIFDIAPRTDDENGGVTVTVTGTNFRDPVRVLFGDVAASGTTFIDSGTLTTIAPPASSLDTIACDDDGDGTSGERFVDTVVDVTVVNLLTGDEDVFANSFTYTPLDTSCRNDAGPPPPPPPATAPTASFTISGASGATAVTVTNTSTGGPFTTESWTFDDGMGGITMATGTVAMTPSMLGGGTWTITLTVTDAGGTDTITRTQVVPCPVAGCGP